MRIHLLHTLALVLLLVGLAPAAHAQSSTADVKRITDSVVRISATAQVKSYREPWQAGGTGQGVGTGFIVAGDRIMTNAHVVSNARFLQVQREDSAHAYEARVLFIAHDCDLALLTVDDPTFYKGSTPLDFGGLPHLDSQVAAFGFPIGGNRLSVTRGIVSRLEFGTYSHSGMDSHLTIQVDAAINPGNSGGPVIQDGKVVGVAFQGLGGGVAQNVGYMIPVPVIQRFIDDVKDGDYEGYVELAVDYLPLTNPSYRRFLKLPDNDVGVIVTRCMQDGSAWGSLERGDVLLSIDGHEISSDGRIAIDDSMVRMEEIVERKFHGETVEFGLLRGGKPMKATVTLKGGWPFRVFSRQFDENPEYILFAGLLFQRLSRNFVGNYSVTDPALLYYLDNYITDEIYLKHPDVVVMSNVLPDSINSDVQHLKFNVVESVNGVEIKHLSDMAAELAKPAERYVIRFIHVGRPIVIESAGLEAARQRIKERYQIEEEMYLGPTGPTTAAAAADTTVPDVETP